MNSPDLLHVPQFVCAFKCLVTTARSASSEMRPSKFAIASLPSLAGKTFLVTGGNTGIGYATCLNLAAKSARVFLGARSPTKASEAVAKIKAAHPAADVQSLLMDHRSLRSVVEGARIFTSKGNKLHGLILNAGIMATPYEETEDGFEVQMQVNYLAHWLLTYHLLPRLLETAREEGPGSVRVVSVSAKGHQVSPWNTTRVLYDRAELEAQGPYGRYGATKLANVLLAKSLNKAYGPATAGRGEIWTASVHPGFIDTQLNEKNQERTPWHLSWFFPVSRFLGLMRPWEEGTKSSLFVSASPEFRGQMSGAYFNEHAQAIDPNPAATDEMELKKLERWTMSAMKKGGWI